MAFLELSLETIPSASIYSHTRTAKINDWFALFCKQIYAHNYKCLATSLNLAGIYVCMEQIYLSTICLIYKIPHQITQESHWLRQCSKRIKQFYGKVPPQICQSYIYKQQDAELIDAV